MCELEALRRSKGLKQAVLCQTIGISTKTYAHLMRGECNRLDVFLALIDHLCKGRGEVKGYGVMGL